MNRVSEHEGLGLLVGFGAVPAVGLTLVVSSCGQNLGAADGGNAGTQTTQTTQTTAGAGGQAGAGGDCEAGTADCDDDPSNGCETDVTSDVENCGACDSSCPASPTPHGYRICTTEQCGVACYAGFVQCDVDSDALCATDTNTSSAHCGACNHSCFGGPCTGGVCGPVVLANHYVLGNVRLDDEYVYYYGQGHTFRMHQEGGSEQDLGPFDVQAMDNDTLYATYVDGSPSRQLWAVDKGTGAAEVMLDSDVYEGTDYPWAFAVDSEYVYFVYRQSTSPGACRIPKIAGTLECEQRSESPKITAAGWGVNLLLAQDMLYWFGAPGEGSIMWSKQLGSADWQDPPAMPTQLDWESCPYTGRIHGDKTERFWAHRWSGSIMVLEFTDPLQQCEQIVPMEQMGGPGNIKTDLVGESLFVLSGIPIYEVDVSTGEWWLFAQSPWFAHDIAANDRFIFVADQNGPLGQDEYALLRYVR